MVSQVEIQARSYKSCLEKSIWLSHHWLLIITLFEEYSSVESKKATFVHTNLDSTLPPFMTVLKYLAKNISSPTLSQRVQSFKRSQSNSHQFIYDKFERTDSIFYVVTYTLNSYYFILVL